LNQYKKLAFNTVIFALGNIGSKSIIFLLLPVFTRYMLPSDYGKLDIINTTISLLTPILSLQLVEAVFRFAVDFRDETHARNVLSNVVVFSFLSFLFALALYPLLSIIGIFREYKYYFYGMYLVGLLNGAIKQFVRGLGLVKLYAVSDILFSVVFALSNTVLLVGLKLGVKAYLLSTVFAQTLCIIFLFYAASLWRYLELRIDFELIKTMLSYSIPLIPNGIMWWIVTASDRYFLSYFLGYDATGIYSVAARFPALLTVVIGIFFQAWQLSAMEEFGKEGYSQFFKNTFRTFSSLMFLLASALLLIIKPFMQFYVGESFRESWKYTPMLILASVYHSFASFYGVNYTASKKTFGAFNTSVLAAGMNVAVLLLLIKTIGIQAASLSSFVAYLTMWTARIFHTRKLTQVELDTKHVVFSTILIVIQAILLLTLKVNSLLYISQLVILIIMLLLQRKYLSNALRFSKMLVKERKMIG